jgi:hypothetical protein
MRLKASPNKFGTGRYATTAERNISAGKSDKTK